jgi:hypothetical protein
VFYYTVNNDHALTVVFGSSKTEESEGSLSKRGVVFTYDGQGPKI